MSKSILLALVLAAQAGATPVPAPNAAIEARQYSSWDPKPSGPPTAVLAVIIVISVVAGIGIIGGLIWKFVRPSIPTSANPQWAVTKAADLANRHTDIYANRVDNAYYNPNANGYNASNGYGGGTTYGTPPYDVYVQAPPVSHGGRFGRHNHMHHAANMHHAAHDNHMNMHHAAHNAAVNHATHSTMN